MKLVSYLPCPSLRFVFVCCFYLIILIVNFESISGNQQINESTNQKNVASIDHSNARAMFTNQEQLKHIRKKRAFDDPALTMSGEKEKNLFHDEPNGKDDDKKRDKHSNEKEDDDRDNDDDDNEKSNRLKTSSRSTSKANFGFIHAFFASLSVILVSEIGDKTFFIAAIMAMKHSRCTIYSGAIFALGLMTLLSALLGNIVTKVVPKAYTYYASSFLFAIFGLKMLREGWQMSRTDASEEYEEAHSALKESEEKNAHLNGKDLETGGSSGSNEATGSQLVKLSHHILVVLRKHLSAIFLQAFVLTFLAEWGDRSQISTIILGARENMAGTVIGGTLGHAICTGMAVIGGRIVAQRISVRTVTLVGAFVFLFFAFSAFFVDPDAY